MEKLTLQQLAVYLPYKIQLYRNVTKQMFNISGYETFSDYTNIALTTKEGKFWSSERLESEIHSQFKLVLYPISMLTKEITHGGRTFIPIVELAKICMPDEYFKERLLELPNWTLKGDSAYSEFYQWDFSYKDNFYLEQWIDDEIPSWHSCPVENQFQLFQKLAEWHFNFIGIPEELYIDKSTL